MERGSKWRACKPGCTCGKHPLGNVDNAPFRERIERMRDNSEPLAGVARAAGFVRTVVKPSGKSYVVADTGSMLAAVGARETRQGRYTYRRTTISPATAKRLCEALDIDYTEAGI